MNKQPFFDPQAFYTDTKVELTDALAEDEFLS